MAYYFMVEEKRGKYLPLDITKSKYFSRLSNLKNGATLQEIDNFTMMFYNEVEMRNLLLDEGVLSLQYYSKPLSTRIKKNNKYNKVMYDFLYQKDIEYVCDPSRLISKINDKLQMGKYRFVERFANSFANYHECSSTAPEVRKYAKESIRLGRKSRHFDELDENYDNSLVRMVKLLIYDYIQLPSGRVEYTTNKIGNYRNLHSIIAFVNNYNEKNKEVNLDNQISLFEEPVKKRVRKKDEIDGQVSIFEIMG